MQFLFLNNALSDFLAAIQGVWAPIFQMQGIQILLTIGAIAFFVYAAQLIATQDVPAFILGFGYTMISLAVLHAVFLYSQDLATGVLNGFIQWGQQTSGMSPAVLTPSGIMETGLQLSRDFWAASGAASWWYSPISAIETLVCTLVITASFGIAAIIYLLAQVEVWALIIGASVLLAFAPLPWTWSIFPGWGLQVLSSCIKIFFLLAVLALGLSEAGNWTASMAATTGSIAEDASLAMQAMVQSLLFVGCVYYIPNLMARMVVGASGLAFQAGEALLGGIGGGASAGAMNAAAKAPGALGTAATGAAQAGVSGAQTVARMLLR